MQYSQADLVWRPFEKGVIWRRAGWPGFQADGAHDHRIALSAAVAALAATGPSEITGAECIGVSFPTFAETLAELGAKTEVLR